MKEYSIFDIIGPVMIGPSSSHTAGAVRIGNMARNIVGESIKKVVFCLHGSFAKTYKGHGSDKAFLAGVLGFLPDDERIRNAFEFAKSEGLEFEFIEEDLGAVHPNSVKLLITTESEAKWDISGSSIGAGKANIFNINDLAVDFDGEYTTIITKHKDCPGVVSNISTVLANHKVNIAFMKLFREEKLSDAILIIETDQLLDEELTNELKNLDNIKMVRVINPIPSTFAPVEKNKKEPKK